MRKDFDISSVYDIKTKKTTWEVIDYRDDSHEVRGTYDNEADARKCADLLNSWGK